MNHIYKVIFNKATGTFMAVAEYARSHSSGGSSNATGQVGSLRTPTFARVATLAILAIATMFNASAYAAGNKAVEIGGGSGISKGKASANGSYAVAIGNGSNAQGNQSIAIGGANKELKTGGTDNSTKIGANALGTESIAIGGDVLAKGKASIAIGSDDIYVSNATDSTVTSLVNEHAELREIKTGDNTKKYQQTQATGHASIAVGAMSKASGHFSNAFGTRAEADGAFSVAVGLTSKAAGKSSVALGSASKAEEDQAIAIGSQTEAKGIGAIAIGADGKDTTAVSKKSSTVGTGASASKTNKEHYKDIAGKYLENTNNLDDFATAKTKSNDGAIAIGSQAHGEGVWSNAFGVRARSEGFASTAVGTGSHAQGKGSVALGAGANAAENWSVAIGAGSIAQGTGAFPTAMTQAYDPSNNLADDQKGTNGYGVVSVGRDTSGDVVRRRITNVGAGASDTDAVNVAQLKAVEAIAKNAGGGGGTTTTVGVDDGETHIVVTKTTNGNNNEYKLKLDDDATNAINKVKEINVNADDINKINDGIGFTADASSSGGTSNKKITRKLGENINITGGKSNISDLTENNIGVVANGTNLNIKLAKTLNNLTSVNTQNLTATDQVTVGTGNNTAQLLNSGLTFAHTANAGKTVYGTDGVKFNNNSNATIAGTSRITKDKIGFANGTGSLDESKPYLSKDGINAGNQKITNLAHGTADTNAVTIKQLKDAKPTLTEGTGISITNTNGNLSVDDSTGNVTAPTYTIGVKTAELTSNGTGNNKFAVSGTNNNDGLVTAQNLASYLNTVNQTADTASQTAEGAKTTAETAKSTAEGAKTAADTASQTATQAQQNAQNSANQAEAAKEQATTAKNAAQTAQQKATEAEQKASQSAEQAKQAQQSATQSEQSAQAAQEQATQATNLAQQAQTAATASEQSAQTAKNAAESAKSEATDAKTAAQKSASEATSAKNAAQTAQQQAETAKNAAETAKGEAQTAKEQATQANQQATESANQAAASAQEAQEAKTAAESAKEQAATSASEATAAKEQAATAQEQATEAKNKAESAENVANEAKKAAGNALQTFKVKKDGVTNENETITVGKDDTQNTDTVNTLTLKGENGLTVATNKDGTVTFGIDTTNGLTTPKLTVGGSENGKTPLVIEQVTDNGNHKTIIKGLSSTLPSITNTGDTHSTEQGNTITSDEDKSKAASIADVLNAGFNLKNNGDAKDFVSTYDTVDFANGNATTATVTYDGNSKTSKVMYDVNVDDTTIHLTGNDGNKKLSVKTTTITKTDANGSTATSFNVADNNGDALVKAKDIATHLNTLAGDIQTAKGTAGNALQSLTVKGGNDESSNNGITLNKTSNELTLAGDNGITVKTDANAKKVTVGIDTTSGLKVGKSTLNNSGLTVNNAAGDEQIQVGADGITFSNVNAGMTNTDEGTTRITRDKIGFANNRGQVDENKPHLTRDGINAGGTTISMVKSAIENNPANGQPKDFITRLGDANKDTDKQNSAATVKDLYELSQSPLTFAGDTGTTAKKLGNTLNIKGGETTATNLTENNIGVVAGNNGLTVKLANTLNNLEAVNTKNLTATNSVTVGSGNNTAQLLNSGLTFNQAGAGGTNSGKTVYGVDGLKFTDDSDTPIVGSTRITKEKVGFANQAGSLDESKPHLSKDGINAGNQKISNLAKGTENTDAVTYEQHKEVADKLKDLNKTDIDQVKTALQTFTVKKVNENGTDDETNTITVGKDTINNQVNTLKLKGENGLDVKTDKISGTVTFGIDTTSGLKVGQSTLNSGGLTVNNANNSEQIQVGADGIKFTGVNAGTAGAGIENTARITRDKIGFADSTGQVDTNKPHLTKDGINAGGKEITNVKSAIADAGNNGQPDFVTRLRTAGKDASKSNSAATVKDLYDLSQSPLTFAGDTGTDVTRKLGDTLNIKGGKTQTNELTDNNIGVIASGNTLTVKLAKTLNNLEAVNTKTLNATEKVKVGNGTNIAELQNSGLTFVQPNTGGTSAGKTVYGVDGLKFTDGSDTPIVGSTRITKEKIGFADGAGSLDEQSPYLDKKQLKVGDVKITKDTGINAGNKKISNVAKGENNTDAVNYEQHKQVADKVADLNKDELDQVKTALQTFKVKKDGATDENETITVGKDDKQNTDTVNTLKLKGENGVDVKTKKDGTVTFGIDQTKGLTTPKLTVGDNANGNGNKVSIDKDNGIHFLTQDGQKDTNAPAITKDGINAGGKAITGLPNLLTDATNAATGHVSEITGLPNGSTDTDKTRAASIGDVLNAGFNLKNNGDAKDFVSTYDTVDFINGNATTATVTYDEATKTSKVVYNVNVDDQTIHLTGDDGNKKLGVKTTTLTSNGTGANKFALNNQGAGSDNGDALIKAKDIASNLNALAGEIHTAKVTAGNALQSLTVKGSDDENTDGITLDKTNKELTLAGNNGIAVKTDANAKKITVGIDTDKGLTVGDVKITKDGINAGNKELTNVKSAITKAQEDESNGINEDNAFVKGLETDAKNTNKQNSAVTVSDLNAVAQTPMNFKGDDDVTTMVRLGDTLPIVGGISRLDDLTDEDNIGVVSHGKDALKVRLAKDLKSLNSVNTKTLTATNQVTVGTGNNTAQLLNSGLTFAHTANAGKTVYGADGLKFTDNGNTPIAGSTRITKDEVGFANQDGSLDKTKPHLDKKQLKVGDVAITTDSGINAGNRAISNVGQAMQDTDAINKKQLDDAKTELKGEISKAKGTADTALQTFTVKKHDATDDTETITVGKETKDEQVNTLKLKGENGVDIKTDKASGTVTFGIDQTKGLTTPKLTVGDNTNGKTPLVIEQVADNGNHKTIIKGLSSTLPNITDAGGVHTTEQGNTIADTNKTRAASIGDVLNAGFNLQGNGTAVDFVSTYDTVNFADGNVTTAKVTYDGTKQTSTVVYDVNVDNKTVEVTSDKKLSVKTTKITNTGTNGQTNFSAADGEALVKAKDIATHLNTLASDIQTAKGASQAGSSAGYVDADGNKVIYDSTDKKYYQASGNGQADKTKEVAKDKLVAQAQTPDGKLTQMNVKSVITKAQKDTSKDINEDNAFVKGLEKAASDNKTKNAAVTVNDLHQVASTPITFKSDDGVHSQVNLGDTFAMTGGANHTNLSDGKNIGVVSQPDGIQFKLAKDLTDLNSVSAGGTRIDDKGVSFVDPNGQAKAGSPVLSANGLDMGGKRISNVGNGIEDTDAANIKQLNEVRSLLGLGNAGGGNTGNGNTGNAGGGQVNIIDIKKDPNSGSSSNSPAIKAGTVLGGKGNNDAEKLANGGVQVGVDKEGRANGDLSNVWVKTQKDGSKKALLATYNVQGQTNYLTNNPAEAIDRMNEQGIRFFHVNDGNQEPVVQGRNSVDSSASGKHSAAVGYQAQANGEAAVAVGRQTQAGKQSIAIGDKAQATGNQSIAIGTGNVVTGKHSGAIGDPSIINADNSYSIGNNNKITNVSQKDVFALGNDITVTESNSVALGSNSAISAGTKAGTKAKKSDGTAGATTTAGATGTVKGFAGETAVGAVSVGASGAERRIQNVAAGEVSATSTDAVNGSQLHKATQELGYRIHQNENKANAGISSAMAMASMPQAYIPGRSMVTGGIATYNGQGAVAVGLSKLSDNGQWIFKINGSADTQGNAGAAVGAGFHW